MRGRLVVPKVNVTNAIGAMKPGSELDHYLRGSMRGRLAVPKVT